MQEKKANPHLPFLPQNEMKLEFIGTTHYCKLISSNVGNSFDCSKTLLLKARQNYLPILVLKGQHFAGFGTAKCL